MTNNEVKQKQIRGKVYFYNTESLFASAIAKELGYSTVLKYTGDVDLENDILEESPDYLVVNVSFCNFRLMLHSLEKIKSLLPSIKIIVTGEPFLTYNTNVTYENPFIDYVITGEVEYTLRDILDGEADNDILGICYTDENMQSAKNEKRPFIENLDNLPTPSEHPIKNNTITIEVSRGCPYHCFFCLASVNNGIAHRVRSPQSIVNEIKYCIKKYNIKNFCFKSDIFNFDNKWVMELCRNITDNELKIHWSCDILPKNIDENIIKLMYSSGLRHCRIGVESGSKEILEKLDKDISIENIKQTITLLKKYKIKTTCYYLFGLPWETEETAEETTKLAIELDSDNAVFNIAVPFAGTKFFVYTMLNKLFSPQSETVEGEKRPLARSHSLSQEKILELKNEAEKRFYNRPKRKFKSLIKKLFNYPALITQAPHRNLLPFFVRRK